MLRHNYLINMQSELTHVIIPVVKALRVYNYTSQYVLTLHVPMPTCVAVLVSVIVFVVFSCSKAVLASS